MAKFSDLLPEEFRKEFLAILEEGKAVAMAALQAASDVADSEAQTMASAIFMRWASWLQSLGLSTEFQQSIQDLPFNGLTLFSKQTDTKLHGLKDSRTTLRSLGLYTPGPARKWFKPQQTQKFGSQPRSEPYSKKGKATSQHPLLNRAPPVANRMISRRSEDEQDCPCNCSSCLLEATVAPEVTAEKLSPVLLMFPH
ncbi:hypothetical protein UY3_09261 [Chelonia mydas]|uniref:Uncharacterized protein n=1 Tax=Chelonia mydas TaxID=8469 RepID=M7BD87_CHEMY|nr:hypothetical protein UY3_09261 [Chelonia mydas]